MLEAGTIINIMTEDGKNLLTFKPFKTYQSVTFSSPDLKNNATYNIYTGGSAKGNVNNGFYTDGTYSPGKLYTNFTVSGITTYIGNAGYGPGGGRGR